MRFNVTHDMIDKAVARHSFDLGQRRRDRAGLAPPRTITISRDFGAGGRQVALRLAKLLDWSLWDKEILDVLAAHGGEDLQNHMFESLDEKVQGEIDALLSSMFGQTEKHTYFMLLPRAIYTIAQDDALILGRGAHLLLPDSFRVHLTAPFETRVTNLMKLYDLTRKEARKEVLGTDKEREMFIKQLSKNAQLPKRPAGTPEFDMWLNTEPFTFDQAAEVVAHAMEKKYA